MKNNKENEKLIQQKLKNLPDSPGVYQFLDESGKIIYIGKAKNLKKRVRSYFQKKEESPKTKKLRENICDLKFIETKTETEAFILESNLIKENQPKYNILLRDDKHYIYIRIDQNEDFPKISIVRKVERDGAKYFGPKTSATTVRDILKMLRKSFPHRTCKMEIKLDKNERNGVKIKNPDRRTPCLDHHIHLCPGCCVGKIESEEYKENIEAIVNYLEGREEKIIKKMKEEMMELAGKNKFERAARVRDRMLAIEKIMEKQSVDGADFSSRDIVGFFSEGQRHFFNLFIVRNGKLIDQVNLTLTGEDSPEEIISAFLKQYYTDNVDLPEEVLVPIEIEGLKIFEEALSEMRGKKVKIIIPKQGGKNRLLKLAKQNAEAYAVQQRASFEMEKPLSELEEKLSLERKPKRIECYDISHSGGEHTVGSMVVFLNGKSVNAHYKNFKIRSLDDNKIDDYQSLSEVIKRRMYYLTHQLPDGFEMRKIRKKDKLPKEINEKEEIKNYLVISMEDEIIAGVKMEEDRLENLFVHDEYQGLKFGHELVRKIIDKSKKKKVYVCSDKKYMEFWMKNGFEALKTVPEKIKQKKDKDCIYMVWNKSRQEKDDSFESVPDLVVLDGGKGQLSSVVKMVNFPKKTQVVALAKREEEVFVYENEKINKIDFEENSAGRRMLMQVRDEAHRFANEYRRKLGSGKLVKSALDDIKGIGEKTRKELLQNFGSVERIKKLSEKELADKVGEKKAKEILRVLKSYPPILGKPE